MWVLLSEIPAYRVYFHDQCLFLANCVLQDSLLLEARLYSVLTQNLKGRLNDDVDVDISMPINPAEGQMAV